MGSYLGTPDWRKGQHLQLQSKINPSINKHARARVELIAKFISRLTMRCIPQFVILRMWPWSAFSHCRT